MIPDHPALPIALGAYEVDLLDLTSAYQVFQNDGKRVESYLITAITTAHGDQIYRHPDVAPVSVYDAGDARQMIRMMEGVLIRGTGKRAAFGRPAAGKTGTSQNWRDAWFVGFTPDWIAGVWVGNDKSLPMNKVAGGELPSEMWRRFMIAAHEGMPVRDFEGLADLDNPPAHDEGLNALGDSESLAQTPLYSQPPPESEDDPVPPQPPPPSQRQRGSDFYSGLADDLGRAADGQGPQ
jgi:penicillin-binding protein 1A